MNQPSLWDCADESQWSDFTEAREFAHSLNLNSKGEWETYVKGALDLPEIPENIPPDPEKQYRFLGWKSWEDWLGIMDSEQQNDVPTKVENLFESNAYDKDKVLNFKEARSFARSLGFEYKEEWEIYTKGLFSERKPLPENIPARPDMVYRFTGWKDWKDWLMNPDKVKEYSSLKEARGYIQCFRLKSKEDYRFLIQQADSPLIQGDSSIILPDKPDLEYTGKGWISWDDYMGTEIEYKSYKDTSAFIHSLKLRSRSDWVKYCNGEFEKLPPRPDKVFVRPDIGYKGNGWISWDDWLGVLEQKGDESNPGALVECRCKGRIKDCPECDGKGYIK